MVCTYVRFLPRVVNKALHKDQNRCFFGVFTTMLYRSPFLLPLRTVRFREKTIVLYLRGLSEEK